jgi:hypothetical protein
MTQTLPTNSPKRLLLVGDYGTQDLAFFEVKQRLYEQAAAAGLELVIDIASTDSFDIAQTATLVESGVDSGQYDAVYHNTAPRLDGQHKDGNVGEGLAYISITTADGRVVPVVGVASGNAERGNSFSRLTARWPDAPLHQVEFDAGNTQFRSRDLFPQEVIRVLTEDYSRLREVITVDELPATEYARALASKQEEIAEIQREKPAISQSLTEGYITLIAAPEIAESARLKLQEQRPGAVIDVLPLKAKDPENRAAEASFVAAQLGANAETEHLHRALVVVDSPEALAALDSHEPSYVGQFYTGATLISPSLQSFSFAHLPAGEHGERALVSLAPLPWWAGLSQGFDQNLAILNQQELFRTIPELHGTRVAYVDGYGNVKLAHFFEDIAQREPVVHLRQPNEPVAFRVESLTDTSFATQLGQHNISRGSSGWLDKRFTEVWVRNNHPDHPGAAVKLGNVEPGAPLLVDGIGWHDERVANQVADESLRPTGKVQGA